MQATQPMNTLERPRRLRDVVRHVMRKRRYSPRTVKTYWYWIRYFIRVPNMSHPRELCQADVQTFLIWLAVERGVAASTRNQALNALVFRYAKVLESPLGQTRKEESGEDERDNDPDSFAEQGFDTAQSMSDQARRDLHQAIDRAARQGDWLASQLNGTTAREIGAISEPQVDLKCPLLSSAL
jgi:hypothetical protein